MSQTDNVWSAADESVPSAPADLPPLAYGEGYTNTECFNFGTLWRLGVALLVENPTLTGVAAGAFIALQITQVVLSTAVSVGLTLSTVAANQTGLDVPPDVIAQLGQAAVALLFLPFTMLVQAGTLVAFATYITSDESRFSLLVTSVRAAVMALVYGIIGGAIGFALIAIFVAMPAGLGFVLGGGIGAGETAVISTAIGGFLGLLVGIVPMLYVSYGLLLGTYAVVLDGISPVEALAVAWEGADGVRLHLFLFALLFGVASAFAPCTLYLLLIPAIAIFHGGLAAAWLAHSRSRAVVDAWPFFERNPVSLKHSIG